MNFRLGQHIAINGVAWFSLLFCVVFLNSCKSTRHIPEGQYLLKKNKVKGIHIASLDEGATMAIRHRPNRKVLGVSKLYLAIYNVGIDGDDSASFRKWFRKNIGKGEAPVIYDSLEVARSAKQIESYLFNQGYYDAAVRTEVKIRRRKATVTYYVTLNDPYLISDVRYSIFDKAVSKLVMDDSANRVFKVGDVYTVPDINTERDRITKYLQDSGYYKFNREYIVVYADTNKVGNFVALNINIRNPEVFKKHNVYKINRIDINIRSSLLDSVNTSDSNYLKQAIYIDSKHLFLSGYPIDPEIIADAVTLDSGDMYSQEKVRKSVSRLSSLAVFRSVNYSFVESAVQDDPKARKLDMVITMIPYLRQHFILEPQFFVSDQNVTLSQNQPNYGIGAAVTYKNKNMFKNAEVFELRLRSSLESQSIGSFFKFQTIQEYSAMASIAGPQIRIFKPLEKREDAEVSKSRISGSYSYETNIDFTRQILTFGYSEEFQRNLYSFVITPFELSLNKTDPKRDFLALVPKPDSIFIANLFQTNLIPASRISIIYSDKKWSKDGTNFFARVNLESAGFVARTIMEKMKLEPVIDGRYGVERIPFEQYLKIDAEARYNLALTKYKMLAFRLHTGAGFAYGNSEFVPFVKRFFIGGANSLRGWRPRTVGPGTYNAGGLRVDRTGEIILEAQGEYRFPLVKGSLYGALFSDAGNVWYTKELPLREGAAFPDNRFFDFAHQLAVDAGVGLRYDNFIVLRFDFGLPLRQPDLPAGERWLFSKYYSAKTLLPAIVVNLGVGYPF